MSNIQQAQKTAMQTVRELFESRAQQLATLIPKHLTPDRLIKVALNCISKTPQLQQCSPSSLLQCLITSAELGLEPGGALGHAYLVPYKEVCTLIIGYRGFIELMRRSGKLEQIEAHVVHEADDFEVEYGLDPKLRHKPCLTEDTGAVVGAYCIARLKDGGKHVEFMTAAAINRIRERARSRDNGPWKTDYEEMAKKTVLRRAAKYLPLSVEVAKAIEVDDEDYQGGADVSLLPSETATQPDAAKSAGNERAKAIIRNGKKTPAPEEIEAAQLVEPTPQPEPGMEG